MTICRLLALTSSSGSDFIATNAAKCTSLQLASKDADRSWVGFKDSKGKNKVILTILLEIMYSV